MTKSKFQIEQVYTKILTIFEIDNKYPALYPLVYKLRELSSVAGNKYCSQVEWLDFELIEKMQANLNRTDGFNEIVTSISSNPANGLFMKSQVAAMLMEPVSRSHLNKQYLGLSLLFLHFLEKDQHTISKTEKRNFAVAIRKSANHNHNNSKILSKLPEYNGDFETYIFSIKTKLKELRKDEKVDHEQIEFIEIVDRLTIESRFYQEQTQPIKQEALPIINAEISNEIVFRLEHTIVESAGKEIINKQDFSKLSNTACSPSSRYWQRQRDSLNQFSNSILNHQERLRLTEYLREHSYEGLETSLPVIVIALSYFMGMKIDSVIDSYLGSNNFISKSADWPVYLPDFPIAYKPNFGEASREAMLSLPDFIISWFERHTTEIKRVNTLAELAVKGRNILNKEIKKHLNKIRCKGHFRIKEAKLSATMAGVCAVVYRDPILLTIFTRSIENDVPVLAHYLVTTADEVQDKYLALRNMLEGESQADFPKLENIPSPIAAKNIFSQMINVIENTKYESILAFHNDYMFVVV